MEMTTNYNLEQARIQQISDKAAALTEWLIRHAAHCPSAQKHLDPGTIEQAYWHYGYLCALNDVLKIVENDSVK
jgi:hypothetical protein